MAPEGLRQERGPDSDSRLPSAGSSPAICLNFRACLTPARAVATYSRRTKQQTKDRNRHPPGRVAFPPSDARQGEVPVLPFPGHLHSTMVPPRRVMGEGHNNKDPGP